MATIISPSWLDVEKAMIFLMSFWVRAHVAANRVDRAPRHRHAVRAVWLEASSGCMRMSRKVKNFVTYGSEAMYHMANCRMDHVTNRAMGRNVIEYWSIFRLRGILKFIINFHSQWQVMDSSPE